MACADGHVVVIPGANGFRSPIASPDTISPMALLLENIELDQDVLFKQMGERMIRWRDFESLMEPYLASHGAMEIVQTAQALRLPFAFVPTAADLLEDEHLAARNFFETIEVNGTTYKVPGQPFRMSETPLSSSPATDTASSVPETGDVHATGNRQPATGDRLPLTGVRVVDLAQVFAGPACTRILADLGADVIRFEAANRMDVTRNLILTDNDGKDHHWHRASYFIVRNINKREMVLDLTKDEGREIIRRLVAGADVVVESFTPRVMANFGLGYQQLREIKPGIVMCSLSGYGQDGPMRDFGAYGMGLEPASGISSITGYAGEGPMRSGLSFTDPYSGFVGAGAILTALAYRRRTGKGQYIDLSEQEAAVPIMAAALLEYQMTGRLPERMGDRSQHAAPQGCYRCAGDDRWAVISCTSDEEFARLAKAIGHPEWESDGRLRTLEGRRKHHDELDAAITEWTSQRDHYDVMHTLQGARVKAAAVLDGKEALLDPHFKARGQFDVVDQPIVGKRPVQRHVAARFARFEAKARMPSPLLGQHNEEVLRELGYSDDAIAQLAADKVIANEPDLPVPAQFIAAALKLPYERYIEHGILYALEADYQEQLGIA
jgi:crotonobetainyl-CoA:carnitine CoA-transferase CaiB-like acyl-CoA transferase